MVEKQSQKTRQKRTRAQKFASFFRRPTDWVFDLLQSRQDKVPDWYMDGAATQAIRKDPILEPWQIANEARRKRERRASHHRIGLSGAQKRSRAKMRKSL